MNVQFLGRIAGACLAVLTTSAASAQSVTSTESLVAQCAAEIRASGSFTLIVQAPVPQVAAGAGATQRGARNVNDCLKDKYQTQPGFDGATVVAAGRPVSQSQCERLFNRGRGEAFARGFGASLLGGGIGAGLHSATLTANFQRCLEGGQIVRAGGFKCGTSVFVGGSGYCIKDHR